MFDEYFIFHSAYEISKNRKSLNRFAFITFLNNKPIVLTIWKFQTSFVLGTSHRLAPMGAVPKVQMAHGIHGLDEKTRILYL